MNKLCHYNHTVIRLMFYFLISLIVVVLSVMSHIIFNVTTLQSRHHRTQHHPVFHPHSRLRQVNLFFSSPEYPTSRRNFRICQGQGINLLVYHIFGRVIRLSAGLFNSLGVRKGKKERRAYVKQHNGIQALTSRETSNEKLAWEVFCEIYYSICLHAELSGLSLL